MNNRRRALRHLGAAPLALSTWFWPRAALAQSFAFSKPVRWIVPYAAGGLPDTVARVYAKHLAERIGQGIVVDNKPGGNGAVAAQALLAAPPDGHGFLVTDGSLFSVNPLIAKDLPYNSRNVLPVAMMASSPLYLAVNASLPVRSFAEFVEYAKSRPGQLNYGSSGIGSSHHLCMEALKSALGLHIVHIPFRGSGQSVPALVGGQVQCLFAAGPSLSGFAKAGQVRILAGNASRRSPLMPDVPAIAETVPGFDYAVVVGAFAAGNAPREAAQMLAAEIQQAARLPELASNLGTAGVDAHALGAADYAAVIRAENERMAKAVALVGLKQE
ncbi:MAG TPA: tripartite tricarboxylate transporter substrate binding protein [Burkholderiaceae bacterium]|jgi:tripartite-type tricarboxylate transporter receptor subunit TctC|nr:tripartite tricarboxylate transporter substrate binding protein [Burkholderiaceae bacterium]